EAAQLESRRARLDALRIELEDTHRGTLEMRMAVEEIWAELSQGEQAEAAKTRLIETQRIYEEHFQHLRESIAAERRELALAQAGLESSRAALKEEQKLAIEASEARLGDQRQERQRVAEELAALS